MSCIVSHFKWLLVRYRENNTENTFDISAIFLVILEAYNNKVPSGQAAVLNWADMSGVIDGVAGKLVAEQPWQKVRLV